MGHQPNLGCSCSSLADNMHTVLPVGVLTFSMFSCASVSCSITLTATSRPAQRALQQKQDPSQVNTLGQASKAQQCSSRGQC